MAQLQTAAPSMPRRHDLDALRAIAMLLGIALHAAGSFIPDAWVIQDSQQHEGIGLLVMVIHGFRMQLFFLLSGFFTAMLWRRRGLLPLLWHRFRRVFLVLLLGMVTIIPLNFGTFILAYVIDLNAGMWGAARAGDIPAIVEALDAGTDINATVHSWTPLHVAAEAGQTETVRWLIQHGANVNAINEDGNTPLDLALAKSHTDVAAVLRAQGAHAERHKPPGSAIGSQEGQSLVALSKTEVFGHLWFLWFLCWLVVGFAVAAVIVNILPFKRLPARLVVTPLRYLWLVPLTMIPQAFMAHPSFGPDTSTGIIPMPHVLAYYAIFFGFGALYFHYDAEAARDKRRWWLTLPFGLIIVLPLAVATTFESDGWNTGAVLLQALFPWVIIFGSMGLFRQIFSRERKRMRYLSDSSYFLYLAHMPLIIVAQILMRGWDSPLLIKYVLMCIIVTALLLFVYEHLVRYRWPGRLLNGRRQRPEKQAALPSGATWV